MWCLIPNFIPFYTVGGFLLSNCLPLWYFAKHKVYNFWTGNQREGKILKERTSKFAHTHIHIEPVIPTPVTSRRSVNVMRLLPCLSGLLRRTSRHMSTGRVGVAVD